MSTLMRANTNGHALTRTQMLAYESSHAHEHARARVRVRASARVLASRLTPDESEPLAGAPLSELKIARPSATRAVNTPGTRAQLRTANLGAHVRARALCHA
uniref:Uncharacterized protein n=1 Tax=Chrysotila carterae TaxID=13221 RepID=A0A7S4BHM8_CHRCT|eukprot:4453948-Pleurochrysis_carterae.AAC.1